MHFTLSPQAENDLDTIWDYSYSQWGRLQANGYVTEIHSAILQLTETPHIGTAYDTIRRG
jgi:toxin ParE1/3/4